MISSASRSIITALLDRCQALQLATLHEGRPRLCSLHFAPDGDLNLYWLSRRNRIHSLDLLDNPECAVGMIIDTEVNQCLHFEGTARLLTGDETEKALQSYTAKFGELSPATKQEINSNDVNEHGIFVFTPKVITLYDELNFPKTPKQVIDFSHAST